MTFLTHIQRQLFEKTKLKFPCSSISQKILILFSQIIEKTKLKFPCSSISQFTKMKSNIKDKKPRKEVEPNRQNKFVEYEYLVKLKGKSYLHLEWKLGSDLESMNKSAKTLYRRFLKKLESGTDENLEDPSFDPSFAIPQKIVAEKEQKVMVELSDKELIAWEKERERELMEEKSDSENGDVPTISEVVEEEKKDTSSEDEINKLDQEGKKNNDDENGKKLYSDIMFSLLFLSLFNTTRFLLIIF